MDPNAALAGVATLTGRIKAGEVLNWDEQVELAQGIDALGGWIRGGGFLPTAWAPEAGR